MSKITAREAYFGGAIGALILSLADLLFQGTNSLSLKMAEIIRTHLLVGTEYGGLIALIMVMLLGVALCWVHEPGTRTDSFTRGSSVFAILIAVTPLPAADGPAESPQPSPGETPQESEVSEPVSLVTFSLFPRVFAADTAPLPAEITRTGNVEIYLQSDLPLTVPPLVTLRNLQTDRIVSRFHPTTPGGQPVLSFQQPEGEYIIEIEAPGIRRLKSPLSISGNNDYQDFSLELEKSWIPLNIQRLYSPKTGMLELVEPGR